MDFGALVHQCLLMRLEPLPELTAEQAELSKRIAGQRGGLPGPFQVWIRSPGLCDRIESLATYCQSRSALPVRLRELTLMIVARHFGTRQQWNAHLGKAAGAGLDPEALARLDRGEEPRFPAADEETLYEFATELLDTHFVSDKTFAAALAEFGEPGLVDLIGSLGNYAMFSMALNVFEVG